MLGYPSDDDDRPRTIWHVLADDEAEARQHVLADAEAAVLTIMVNPTLVRHADPKSGRGIAYRGDWPPHWPPPAVPKP